MLVTDFPPVIAAERPDDLAFARYRAEHADSAELSRRESARWTGIDSLPLLTSTDEGMKFLTSPRPRALARGMPAEVCPVMAAEAAEPGTPSGDVAVKALQSCLAQVGPGQAGCGCRVVALDDMVTIPASETGFATGTTARLRAPSLGLDLILVAEAITTEAGQTGALILLRDLRGVVAQLIHTGPETVRMEFTSSGAIFEGRRIPVGFRRGRIAERIYASDAEGNRLSLLIGFEPSELAAGAGAWLAWPPEG